MRRAFVRPTFPTFIALVALCLFAAHSVSAQPGQVANQATTTLIVNGYDVQNGLLDFVTLQDCAASPNCVGNNPVSPYGLFYVPPGPGETPVSGETNVIPHTGLHDRWRLRSDEAIVFIGQTPPEVRYFGFTPYLASRQFDTTMNCNAFVQQTGAGPRCPFFASVDDPRNQFDFSQNGASPFNQSVAVILTASQTTDQDIRKALQSSTTPPKIIQTMRLPAVDANGKPYLRTGLNPTDDTFTSLFRVAIPSPDQSQAYQNYINDPSTYAGSVFRISRSANNTKKDTPFAVITLKSRVTSNTERSLQSELDYLTNQVKTYYSAGTTSVQTYSTTGVPIDKGFQCINNGFPCFGDTRDTPYINSGSFTFGSASTTSNDFVIVTGVQHEATGNAVYTDVTVSYQERHLGVVSAIQKDMINSVAKYLPQQLPSGYDRQEMINKGLTKNKTSQSCIMAPDLTNLEEVLCTCPTRSKHCSSTPPRR